MLPNSLAAADEHLLARVAGLEVLHRERVCRADILADAAADAEFLVQREDNSPNVLAGQHTIGGELVRTLVRGDCFGEIALLRDVPRTASVTARTQALLDALDGVSFISAVTGHDPSARAAGELVRGRLERATIPS